MTLIHLVSHMQLSIFFFNYDHGTSFFAKINVGTTGLQPLPLQATPRSWKVCFSPEIDILHTYSESLFERPSLL